MLTLDLASIYTQESEWVYNYSRSNMFVQSLFALPHSFPHSVQCILPAGWAHFPSSISLTPAPSLGIQQAEKHKLTHGLQPKYTYRNTFSSFVLLQSQVELKFPINFNMNNFTVKMKEMFCLHFYFYLISMLNWGNKTLHCTCIT